MWEVFVKIPDETAGSILSQALEHLGKPGAGTEDDVFTFLNELGVQDVGVVFAPKGVQMVKPVHVVYYSTGRGGSKEGEGLWKAKKREDPSPWQALVC